MCPGGLSIRSQNRGRLDALARPALAEDRQHLAAVQVIADAVDCLDDAAGGIELDREILDLEQMRAAVHGRSPGTSSRQRWTGSAAIRTQLESRLRASVVSMIASPGQNASHQATLR